MLNKRDILKKLIGKKVKISFGGSPIHINLKPNNNNYDIITQVGEDIIDVELHGLEKGRVYLDIDAIQSIYEYEKS